MQMQPTPPIPGAGYPVTVDELRHEKDHTALITTWTLAFLIFVGLSVLFGPRFYLGLGQYVLMAIGGAVLLNFFSTFRAVGTAVRVGPQQYPEIFEAGQLAAARLSMPAVPIYIYQSPYLRSNTQWTVNGYYVMLSSALVAGLEPAELLCIIGQRFGQAKLGTGPMLLVTGQVANPLFATAGSLKILGGFSQVLSLPGKWIFGYWLRLRSHGYRRAGLVATQDIRSCMTAIAKEMVGPDLFPYTNLEALVAQADELDHTLASKLAETVGGVTDAFFLNQMRELLRWYRSPAYQQIAARQGKMGTGTLQYASGGTSMLFGAISAQAQARRGLYSHEWDQLPHAAQVVPPGYKLGANQFRHPQEMTILLVSFALGIVAMLLLGMISNVFIWIGSSLVAGYVYWYVQQMVNLGTMVKVTPQQFPGLYYMLKEAADRLNMDMPPTYVTQDPIVNAYALWMPPFAKMVVVHSGLIEHFAPREVQFVIGHEYGHIKGTHTMLSLIFKAGPSDLVTYLLGPLRSLIKYWFSWWSRAAETTADRAGLIATMDIRVTVASALKLATGGKGVWQQLNVPAMIAQLEQLDHIPLHRLAQSLSGMGEGIDHPFALYRAREAIRFYKSPTFQAILAKAGRQQTGTLQYAQGGTGVLLEAVGHQIQAAKQQGAAQAAAAAQGAAPGQAAQPAQAVSPAQPGPQSPPPQAALDPAAQVSYCPSCGQANRPTAKFCGHCQYQLRQ